MEWNGSIIVSHPLMWTSYLSNTKEGVLFFYIFVGINFRVSLGSNFKSIRIVSNIEATHKHSSILSCLIISSHQVASDLNWYLTAWRLWWWWCWNWTYWITQKRRFITFDENRICIHISWNPNYSYINHLCWKFKKKKTFIYHKLMNETLFRKVYFKNSIRNCIIDCVIWEFVFYFHNTHRCCSTITIVSTIYINLQRSGDQCNRKNKYWTRR